MKGGEVTTLEQRLKNLAERLKKAGDGEGAEVAYFALQRIHRLDTAVDDHYAWRRKAERDRNFIYAQLRDRRSEIEWHKGLLKNMASVFELAREDAEAIEVEGLQNEERLQFVLNCLNGTIAQIKARVE